MGIGRPAPAGAGQPTDAGVFGVSVPVAGSTLYWRMTAGPSTDMPT